VFGRKVCYLSAPQFLFFREYANAYYPFIEGRRFIYKQNQLQRQWIQRGKETEKKTEKLLSRGIILITRTFPSCKLEHVVFFCHQSRNSERAMLSLLVPEDPRIPILPKRICDGADESVEVSLGSTSLFVAFRGPPILQDTQ
jgi:hypothetical protein